MFIVVSRVKIAPSTYVDADDEVTVKDVGGKDAMERLLEIGVVREIKPKKKTTKKKVAKVVEPETEG